MERAKIASERVTRYILYQSNHVFSIRDSHLARCEKCGIHYPRNGIEGFRFCPWCGRFIEEIVDTEKEE